MVGNESIPDANTPQRIDNVLALKYIQWVDILPDSAWEQKWLLTETADALSDRGS